MSATSKIQWTEKTWNPVRGCSIVSPGCVNCYAMKQAHRFGGPGKPYMGLTKQTKAGPQWTGRVRPVEESLLEPLSWRKPKRVFVNSMSDLFHEDVPYTFVDAVFHVMQQAGHHTFQILTKRADRMLAYIRGMGDLNAWQRGARVLRSEGFPTKASEVGGDGFPWPLPNVWLGVSVEDQQRADERIPLLLETPAAVRFLSCEPLLGPLNLHGALCAHFNPKHPEQRFGNWCRPSGRLHWVIVGGESGAGARPCAMEWIESIVQQCRDASVPAFVKQLGAYIVSEERTQPSADVKHPRKLKPTDYASNGEVWAWRAGLHDRKGGDAEEWPEEYRVREFPRVEVQP